MTSLYSYLLTIAAIFFWLFRVVVALTSSIGIPFAFTPLNLIAEIIVLFLFIPAFIFVIKRNIVGAAAYLAMNFAYFGTDFIQLVSNIINGQTALLDVANALILMLGIIIPLLTFIDILFNKHRTGSTKDKKTDWFYRNEKFDRELDERADKNQYKIR